MSDNLETFRLIIAEYEIRLVEVAAQCGASLPTIYKALETDDVSELTRRAIERWVEDNRRKYPIPPRERAGTQD